MHSSGSTAYPKPGKHFVDLIQSSRTKCALYFSPLVKYKLLSKWSNHGHERWMVRLRTSLQPFLVPGSIVSRLDISVPHSVFEYGLRPRFHTMGLTLGLASTICSGSTIVFPLVKQWPPTPNDVIRSLRAGNITNLHPRSDSFGPTGQYSGRRPEWPGYLRSVSQASSSDRCVRVNAHLYYEELTSIHSRRRPLPRQLGGPPRIAWCKPQVCLWLQ